MPQPTTARPTAARRNALVACLLAVTIALPQLLAPNASGDAIGDKRAEARRIAARLDTLRQQVEILAEDYDNAKIQLAPGARARSQRPEGDRRTHEPRDLPSGSATWPATQSARTRAAATTDAGPRAQEGDGSDLGAREGYASLAVGDKADLVDSLRAAKADGDAPGRRSPTRPRSRPHESRHRVDAKRKATAAAVAETQKLVRAGAGRAQEARRAEQARMAAAQQARAVAAAPSRRGTAPGGRTAGTARKVGAPAPRPVAQRWPDRCAAPAPPTTSRHQRAPAQRTGARSPGRPGRRGGDRRRPQRARRPLHVGRRVAGDRVRLLRPGHVGLGPRWQVAAALLRGRCTPWPARSRCRRSSRAISSSTGRRCTTSRCTSVAARSSTRRTPARSSRWRACTTGASWSGAGRV